MKINKYIPLLVLLLLSITINYTYSQENIDSAKLSRSLWYTHYSSAPEDSYYKMMMQKYELRKKSGYHLQTNEQWRSLGPTPINFYGTSAGRVSTVVYDPRYTDGSVIFLGGAQGGVWKSTDGGLTWLPKSDNELALATGSIAIDPNLSGTHSIIYCGTGEGVWFGGGPYSGCGILKSTDGGETWKLIRKGLPYRTIFYKVAIRPGHPNELFAALQTGLYRSTNSGESWKKVIPSGNKHRQCTDVTFSPDGSKVYAIGASADYEFYPSIGYWISQDGGKNFMQYQFTNRENRRTKIEVCKSEPNYVYILYDIGDNTILCKSSDGGFTFTETELGNGGGNAGYNLMLAVHPKDRNTIYFGLANLYKSVDWGNSFCCVGTLGYWGCNSCSDVDAAYSIHPDIHAMDFHPTNPEKIIVGCDGGVYTSDNAGISWNVTLNTTLSLTQFYKFTSSMFNPEELTGGAQDMGMMYKNPGGLTWNISMIGDGANVVSSETMPGVLVGNMAGSIFGVVYSSQNGGLGYSVAANSEGSYDHGITNVPIASHPAEPGVFFMLRNKDFTEDKEKGKKIAGNIMLLRSTDNGLDFNNKEPFSTAPTNDWPQQIAVSRSNPDVIYITTGHGMDYWHYPNHIFKYERKTRSWTDLFENHEDVIPDKFFSSLEINPVDENEVYVGLSGFKIPHLYRSKDGGISWDDISGNLPDSPINDIIIYYSGCDKKNILAATDAGVYISTNDGRSWKEYGIGLPNCLITKMFYNRVSSLLRVSTYGRGIWEIPVPGKIYVNDNFVLNSNDTGLNIEDDIVVCEGGNLIFPFACKINMKAGKQIIVEDGGTIDDKGNEVIFRSKNGDWNGIVIEKGAVGMLDNSKFYNTPTPVQRK